MTWEEAFFCPPLDMRGCAVLKPTANEPIQDEFLHENRESLRSVSEVSHTISAEAQIVPALGSSQSRT